MYFRLNPECHFIRGDIRGAIYDLITGKIYSLDENEAELISLCENNETVNASEELYKKLRAHHVGDWYRNKVYIKKLYHGSPSHRFIKGNPPELQRAYLEIGNFCNRNCWFCGIYGIKRSMGCMGCNKWQDNGKQLPQKRWIELLEELNKLDCREIFLSGGDLTLVWDKTLTILNHARELFEHVSITLHNKSVSTDVIDELNDKADIIIQCDDIKDIKLGSEDHTYLITKKPEELEIDCDGARSIDNKRIMVDYIIEDIGNLTNMVKSMHRNISLNVHKFTNNMKYHPCIGHIITISNNGDIIPCPMMRKHKLGNVKCKELYTTLENEDRGIYKFWNLNLDKIDRCRLCEFRYACNDCRALEESLTGRLEGKILCGYNPTKGD